MKTFLAALSFLLLFFAEPDLFADQVYTWTDKDGNMHITAKPPPQNARIQDVLKYQPRPDVTVPKAEQDQDSEADSAGDRQESEDLRQAREIAEKARKEAEIARAKADEAAKAAEKYIGTHSGNQYMRRVYEYQMREAAEDAKAAEEKAIEAEKKAKLAEEGAEDSVD